MAKLTLTDVASGYDSATTVAANNALVEAAVENTLSRDGTAPNTMSADLDLNSNKVTNVTDGTNAQDAVTKSQLDAVVAAAATQLGDITDVTITGASKGDILVFNGTAWVDLTVGTDDQKLAADSTEATGLKWVTLAGGGALDNLVEDLSPQLGGDLVLNGSDITGTGGITITGNVGITGAITATSYGGITEANLVDKSATETISGVWTYSGGITMNGVDISMADNKISRPVLDDYGVENNAITSTSNAITADLATGNSFTHTLTENTTFTLSNPPATGTYGECIIKIIQDSTTRTVAWPASVKWPGGTAPVISTASGAVDIIVLKTWDGGTTWYGNFSQTFS
jgi:hypothetical protein